MRAGRAVDGYRTLDAGEGRKGEVTYPENEVGPLIHRDPFTDPLDYPLFEVKAECLFSQELNAHYISSLTEQGRPRQGRCHEKFPQ